FDNILQNLSDVHQGFDTRPTTEYIVVPMTIPASPTGTQGPITTTSDGPVQTSDLGCLKDTAEDPNRMYFRRKDTAVLIPGWCNAVDPDGTEDRDIGGWDATETQPVARARATRSTRLRMPMGLASGVTMPDAKKATEYSP